MVPIPLSVSLSYYSRKEIQEEIVFNAKDREAVARFNEIFSKRPDILRHPADVMELAKKGATSFHASEELWKNPLQLVPSLNKSELDELRIGWDLILDIDCAFFEYSKIAADLVIKALLFYKIKSVSCKFSGNNGFHIGMPFEAFPDKIRNEETKKLFPGAPRKIALYIKELIKNELGSKIMEIENNSFDAVIGKTKKTAQEIIMYNNNEIVLNVEPFLNIDTLLISSRHLYRMPYSLNEKSGLVSIPIDPQKAIIFNKEEAIPEKVRVSEYRFIDRTNIEINEGKQLLIDAYDFSVKEEFKKKEKEEKEFKAPENALPEVLFPPCIKLILNGLEDGKKRALFILINYFTSIGWDYGSIEKKIMEWNKKNKNQLREIYILAQLKHHKQLTKKFLPPNCDNTAYYQSIGVKCDEGICSKAKNPALFTLKKARNIKF